MHWLAKICSFCWFCQANGNPFGTCNCILVSPVAEWLKSSQLFWNLFAYCSCIGLAINVSREALNEMIFTRQIYPRWELVSDMRFSYTHLLAPPILSYHVNMLCPYHLMILCFCRHGRKKCSMFTMERPSSLKKWTYEQVRQHKERSKFLYLLAFLRR